MTIYECLGIEKYLIDETIPTDLIIENIDSDDLRCDARVYFKDIFRVSIRSSLNRGNHFMQVIEVVLNRADHINEISALIQKAIRYQVLFVFVFEERYLILRRSFNLTLSTEHVYTDHASFSTDWIYKENLEDDFASMFDTTEIVNCYDEDYVLSFEPKQTASDNGDHRYFDDVIKNSVNLNNAVVDSDVVSLRFLLDWWQLHISGSRVNIFDVLDKVRQVQAYQMIGDYLFVEKEVVSYAISELEESQYILSLGHTGRTPMYYFRELAEPATYIDADNLMLYLLYGCDELYDGEYGEKDNIDDWPADVKRYVHISYYDGISSSPAYSTPKLGFIDDIIRRHRLRGYHLLEDQPLRKDSVQILRLKGYQVLEQISQLMFKDLYFLDEAMKIDLIICLEKCRMRLRDCSRQKYPQLNTYLQEKIKCVDCGKDIIANNWSNITGRCLDCQGRKNRINQMKDIIASVSSLKVDSGFFFTNVWLALGLVSQLPFISEIEIVSSELVTIDERRFPMIFFNEENDTKIVTLHSYRSKEIIFRLCEKIYARPSCIEITFADKETGYKYKYIFKVLVNEDSFSNVYYTAKIFDYKEEYKMTECQKCEMSRMIIEKIAKLNRIIIPPIECEMDGDCMGLEFSCKLVEQALEKALTERTRAGQQISFTGIHSIPYDDIIKVKDPPEPDRVDYEKNIALFHNRMAFTLEELDFSIRTFNCLKRSGINTVGDLMSMTVEDVRKVRNLGRRGMEEIIEKLQTLGLELKND